MAIAVTPSVINKISLSEQTGFFPSVTTIPATVNAGGTTVLLTVAHCGTVIRINKNATLQVITIPSAASCPGANLKFVQQNAAAAGIITIQSPTATSVMGAWTQTTDGTIVPSLYGAAITKFNFLAVSLQGDYADFVSDGTSWVVNGVTNVANGMAFAA